MYENKCKQGEGYGVREGSRDDVCEVMVGNKVVEQVKEFVYLSSMFISVTKMSRGESERVTL